ncbi:MAG TPA: DUF72 domain-containing protein [Chthoniobacterales bacterium]|nr:DUF72 domain-containing protein [Chthoniobacterales bacterium]
MRKTRNFAAKYGAAPPRLRSGRWPATELRVGISGWTYRPWRGVFYPKGLAQNRELEFASRAYNSIEINGSFYSLQRPSSYEHWYAATPPGFIFSVKGPRFITHMKKLRDVETPLANFFGSGVLALRQKLGPVLWQFPPNFGWNEERFRQFFELLPRDTAAAAVLARGHDAKLKYGAITEVDVERPLRYGVEIRHPTFLVPEFFTLLRRHNIAFVFADTAGKWPYAEDLTADFAYIRLHGAEQLYVSAYSDAELHWWRSRIELWRRGKQPGDARVIGASKQKPSRRDVYAYFDNDAKVHAPFDAKKLAGLLGMQSIQPA